MTELEQQAQEELNAIYSSTNESEEEQETETETPEIEETETDELEEQEIEEEKPKTKKEKTEERFKKILSKKNSLETRVAELENQLADKDFYWQRPQAKQYQEEISKLVNERWWTRDEAFNMIAGRENISSKPKWFVWTAKTQVETKTTNDMTTKELETYIKDNKILEQALNQ